MFDSVLTIQEKEETKMKPLIPILQFVLLFFLISIILPSCSAASYLTEAGNITYLNMEGFDLGVNWEGYYGDLIVTGPNVVGWVLVENLTLVENVTEDDISSRCRNISGYLLISNESDVPDINNLVPGDLSVLDAITGTGSDSANNTFTVNTTFVVAGNTINDVPTAYTNVNSDNQATDFREGYLTDGDALVFIAIIDEDTTGFDGSSHDFQFMLPLDPSTDWYVFALFDCEWCGDDICQNEESCSSCEADCGSCEEEPKKPKLDVYGEIKGYEFPPELEPNCTLRPEANISIDLLDDIIYVDEQLRGNLTLNYTSCSHVFDALLRIRLERVFNHNYTIDLLATWTNMTIPFAFNVTEPGRYAIVASLENIPEEIEGTTWVEADIMVRARPEPVSPEEPPLPKVKKDEKCLILGIDCLIIIIILLVIIGILYWLIAKRRKKKEKPVKESSLARAAKHKITGR